MDASILHADLDAFYASVEQLLQPALRGRPVAVGGGVVLAASYEARAFGVRSGMPGRRARERCPELVFAGGHFSEYQRLAPYRTHFAAWPRKTSDLSLVRRAPVANLSLEGHRKPAGRGGQQIR
jgi:nucleotidyltransferase/DNA polymerase involved in DNA repair